MSLINQMLQDLDARRAAHGVGNKLPSDVRPLPKVQARRWPLLLTLIAIVLLTAAVWFLFTRAKVPQPVPPILELAPSAAPLTASVTEKPLSVVSAAPATLVVDDVEPSLQLTESLPAPSKSAPEQTVGVKVLRQPPAQPAPPAIVVDEASRSPSSAAPSRPAPPRKTSADVPRAVVSPAPATPTATVPPLIERTVAAGTPRERADAAYRKAITVANQGHRAEALENLRDALRHNDLHVPARQLLLKLLLESQQRGERDEAIKVLADGLAGQPSQIAWAMTLARLQVDQGDLAAAALTLEFSRPLAAQNPDYLGFSANVLQRLGRHVEAAALFTQAARLAPADGRWWLGLGLALEAEGRSAEAKAAFLRARQGSNLGAELQSLIDQKLR